MHEVQMTVCTSWPMHKLPIAELQEHWDEESCNGTSPHKVTQESPNNQTKKKIIKSCSHYSINEMKFTKVSHLIKVSIGIIRTCPIT